MYFLQIKQMDIIAIASVHSPNENRPSSVPINSHRILSVALSLCLSIPLSAKVVTPNDVFE